MDTNLVWWILVPLFAAVGIHLFFYSRRRRKILENFANSHRLSFNKDLQGKLQKILDDSFSLKKENVLRSFDQISSIIFDKTILIFRAVEVLDLNQYGQSNSTHFSRIIALFKVPQNHEEFLLLDKSMHITTRLPSATYPTSNVIGLLEECCWQCDALPHPLSVSFSGGYGLIYFEPLVVGGETLGDINALYCFAKEIHHKSNNDS